jgi:hypothetical protein
VKRRELDVGKEYAAYLGSGLPLRAYKPEGARSVVRVRLVDLDYRSTEERRWTSRGWQYTKGILVEQVESGSQSVVTTAAYILAPWEEWVDRSAEQEAEQAKARQALADRQAAGETLAERLGKLGLDRLDDFFVRWNGEVVANQNGVEKLLEIIERPFDSAFFVMPDQTDVSGEEEESG